MNTHSRKLGANTDSASTCAGIGSPFAAQNAPFTIRATSRGQLDALYQELCDHPSVVMIL